MSSKARPARRVFYDWEKIQTSPDIRLGAAFEQTEPGVELPSLAFEEEATTAEWLLPALALLVGGFFLGRWWARRKPGETVVAGEDMCGFDMLGAN